MIVLRNKEFSKKTFLDDCDMDNKIFVNDYMCFYSKDKKKYYSYNTKTGQCYETYEPKKVAEMIKLHQDAQKQKNRMLAEPVFYKSAKNVTDKDVSRLKRLDKFETASVLGGVGVGLPLTAIGAMNNGERYKVGLAGIGAIAGGLAGGAIANANKRRIFNKYNPNEKIKVLRTPFTNRQKAAEDDAKMMAFETDVKVYNKYKNG